MCGGVRVCGMCVGGLGAVGCVWGGKGCGMCGGVRGCGMCVGGVGLWDVCRGG